MLSQRQTPPPPPPIFSIISRRTEVLSLHWSIYNFITKQRKQQISRLPPIQQMCAPDQEREGTLTTQAPPHGSVSPGADQLNPPADGDTGPFYTHTSPASLGLTDTEQAGGWGNGMTLKGKTWCVFSRYWQVMEGYREMRTLCGWVINNHRSATSLLNCCLIFCRRHVKGMI